MVMGGLLLSKWKPIFQHSYNSLTCHSSQTHCLPSSMPSSVRIAVVGDVHGDWQLEDDSKALQFLQPDLVVFTGDFDKENVELVKSIADLNMPKAAILGNYDSWFTRRFSHKIKDGVQLQLDCRVGDPFLLGKPQTVRNSTLSYFLLIMGQQVLVLVWMIYACGKGWEYGGGDHGGPGLGSSH